MKHLTWTKLLPTLGLALLVVGCSDPFQRNADPTKDYESLKTDIPRSQYKESAQDFDGVLIDIQVEGSKTGVLNFFEGQETSYKLVSRVQIPGAAYQLKAINLPAGASLVDGQSGDGVWLLKWKPALNTIPTGIQNQSYELQVEVVLDQNTSARAREAFDLDRRNKVKTFSMVVSFPNTQPVLKFSGLDFNKELKVGEVIPLTIEVTDPASSKDRKPYLIIDFSSENQTAESRRFNAKNLVIDDAKRKDVYANGKWTLYRLLDTSMISKQALDPRSRYEGGEFLISALNMTTKLDSAVQMIRFKVKADNKEAL